MRRRAADARRRTDLARTQERLSWLTPGRVLFLIAAAVVFALDRVTKNLVSGTIPYGTEVETLGGLVGITNVKNSGAAFGVAPALAIIFLLASVVVSVGLVVYVARQPTDTLTALILGVILGGTAGNGFDRMVYGEVTDFVNVHFWPVFNVADSAISLGVVALIAGYFLRKPDPGA